MADPIPSGAVALNVEAIGYSNLNDKPGFKMSIQKSGERWYLYVGQFWDRGWHIVDVTDPANPTIVKEIPGPDNTDTGQMEIADGKMITAIAKIFPGWGGDPSKPFDEGVLIWDLRDPLNPKKLGQFKTGFLGVHRAGYPGGKYMHLPAYVPGYKGNIYIIVDISDPAHAVEAGRWWVPGQKTGESQVMPPDTSLHGPAFIVGNLAYLPYGGAGMIILDISDVAHPKEVGRLSMSPPFGSNIGVHTVVPVPERGLAYINSEVIQEDCNEPLNHASIVDIADPAKPRLIAMLPLPLPPSNWTIKSFCERGGRFGPHNQNTLLHNPFVQKSSNLVYLTYFNAGLHIYDVSTPTAPREAGYFLPPDPTRRYGPYPKGKLVAQSEDVLVDTRGFIYVTHKNQGLWILRYTGK
ncbi:LVIVD repeat-containing protein [Afipia sp. GAS231]|uniref:LVIVD repeat-containing protein n=1 Tax=Afipia sp. GAS231 TaxID=1882747 RepID=UPI00087CCA85|nr:hypothetical protein [Afipia sp. GAS231]SDN38308.1 Uncharacterized conserved protein [Afipia sp. GAS231]